tara:strand:- start:2369 stop:2779 length:411 start_codon:yes stop_codon:yes gene_type:complete
MRYVILAVICSIFLGIGATHLSAHQNKTPRKHIDKKFEKRFRGNFDRHFRVFPDHYYKHSNRHFGHRRFERMSRGSQIIIILEGSQPPRRHHSRRPPVKCEIKERPQKRAHKRPNRRLHERPEKHEKHGRPQRPRH